VNGSLGSDVLCERDFERLTLRHKRDTANAKSARGPLK
jgi:hypothetical protein